jgi:hypothetical protein
MTPNTSNGLDKHDPVAALVREAGDPTVEPQAAHREGVLDQIHLALQACPVPVGTRGRKLPSRTIRYSALAASVLIGAGLLWMTFGKGNLSASAFAGSIPGVDDVQTMTWTTTAYNRVTSEDGKRTWIRKDRILHAYRHPGQYRDTWLDEHGQPYTVEITDARLGRTLALQPKQKKATMKLPWGKRGSLAPFAWVGKAIRDREWAVPYRVQAVSLEGQKEIDGLQATDVRVKVKNVEEGFKLRFDFFFDVPSKRLVGIWEPHPWTDFDHDTAPDRDNPAEEKWSMFRVMAGLEHEMVLNPKLDPLLFSLDPPPDYAFEGKLAKPTLTEDEMIAYLGAAAQFNDKQFPDSPYVAFDRDKFNAASRKAPGARTQAEQAMIAMRDKFMMRGIYRAPVLQFVDDQTAPSSFHYVGAGVRVGQADRLVAWYRLRNGTKYRAIYGDLSVRDVTEAELPLKLSQ